MGNETAAPRLAPDAAELPNPVVEFIEAACRAADTAAITNSGGAPPNGRTWRAANDAREKAIAYCLELGWALESIAGIVGYCGDPWTDPHAVVSIVRGIMENRVERSDAAENQSQSGRMFKGESNGE